MARSKGRRNRLTERRGSGMSTKQLAWSVKEGRPLSLVFPGGVPVGQPGQPTTLYGYLAGIDDYNLFIVEPSGQQHLVHKGAPMYVTIGTQASYWDEPNREDLDRLIGPFRSWVLREIFSMSATGGTRT